MAEQLTPEQKEAITKLVKGYFRSGFSLYLKYLFYIYLSAALTLAVNYFYVQSPSFSFPIMLINLIFIMSFMVKESQARKIEFEASVKKILHPDKETK